MSPFFKTKERIVLHLAQKTLEEQATRNASEGKLPRDLIHQRLEWVRTLPQLPLLMQSREIEELLDDFQVTAHRSALEELFGKRFDEDPQLFHFYFGGVSRIVKEWLRAGCREPTREITDSIVSLTRAFATAVRDS